LGIRINEVEELVKKYLPTPDDYAEQSITLARTANNLGNFYPRKIRVSNEKQLSELVYSIENFFLTTGFRWLDQMIDPYVLEQEFLNHKEGSFENYNMVESAFRSTALSKLYNPEDYPILRQSFLEKINSEEMTPFTIAAFLQFLNYLDNFNPVAA
jgi:mannose-6-phosphate isomerase class I